MFSYTVKRSASEEAFEKTCLMIESRFRQIEKDRLLKDVDGTTIQVYRNGVETIKVCNDYEVDAVYVDSEVELQFL